MVHEGLKKVLNGIVAAAQTAGPVVAMSVFGRASPCSNVYHKRQVK